MNEAFITQLVFDITTAILLLLWYFPIRWVMSERVHPLKVNTLFAATLSLERIVKLLFLAIACISPLLAFFVVQHVLLPKFIVAGHIGIWIASAPLFFIACFFVYHLLQLSIKVTAQGVHADTELILADLRTRCANTLQLIAENNSLRNSQTKLAKEADATIATYRKQNNLLSAEVAKLLAEVAAQAATHKTDDTPTLNHNPVIKRPDAVYYVRISEMIEKELLLRGGQPVSRAHAKRYLTKARPWIKQAKSGGALYAKVGTLLRKGYETAEKPLAKSLLFRCETADGEFSRLDTETPLNKAVSHLRTLAPGAKPHLEATTQYA